MAIAAGALFGSYRVEGSIGVGGMGEVYRARDTELGRDVAIKVLPASFANDAMRVARFDQEAKTLASLNHANIAHIYGLARSDGVSGIVMELVEGPTLADRIVQGALPVDEALGIAGEIANALEAAHERGIVHRDLKPANIKLNPEGAVKVLDFGIAKALDVRFLSGPGPAALTTPAMTEAGFILGTAAYMSPEQAKGKPVDQRTDVWSFGCVLYEMLSGKPAFLGEDVTSTLARVLEVSPDWNALPARVSPAVRRTLELCLEKDVRKRVADMRDVKLALAGKFATDTPVSRPLSRRLLPVVGTAAAAALLAGAAGSLLQRAPVPDPQIVTRFNYALPTGVSFRGPVTSVLDIAPNGEFFAFSGSDGIYVRRMGDLEARRVSGTSGNQADVVISPDGREVAYFRPDPPQLLKISLEAGAPVVLATSVQEPFGLSWETDGTLYFGQPDGIWRVSDNGGTPERVIRTESGKQPYGPQLLPGGEWVLFSLAGRLGSDRWNSADIVIQSLRTGEQRVLRSGGYDARYLASGHLSYVFQNTLFVSAFDTSTLELHDDRVAVVSAVQTSTGAPLGGSAFYAVSNNGTLIFVPGTGAPGPSIPQHGLAWVDRQGNVAPLPVRPDNYTMARLSPDGQRVALVVGSTLPATEPTPDIYVFDLETENLTQLTFNPEPDDGPVWSSDGSRIFYRAYKDNVGTVTAISSDGGTPEPLATSESSANPLPWSISPDGETLLLVNAADLNDVNLATLDIGRSGELKPLLDLSEQVTEPMLSPNGQWMLYYEFASSTALQPELAIRPFPDVRQQRRPLGPGMHGIFSRDGSEIFIFDGQGISVAPVQYAPFRVGSRRQLFRGDFWYGVAGPNGALGRSWDVDSKNDRFLMITANDPSATSEAQPEIAVVINWFEELRQRVPARRAAR